MNKIRSFVKLPRQYQLWFISGYLLSAIARTIVLLLPFRYLSLFLGKHYNNTQVSVLVTEEQQLLAWHIGRITALACQYTPWESKCLVQAIVAKCFLNYYRIPYVLYFGVTKPTTEAVFKAHAWLSVGRWVITGREGHKAFAVVSTFIYPAMLNHS